MANESVLHPSLIVPVGHVEPVPRRIRGLIGGRVVFDTRRALYVWEWRAYPQFSIPVEDLVDGVLIDDDHTEHRGAGPARRHTLQVGSEVREGAAWVWDEGSPQSLLNTVRFEWDALDSWFEEDEPVFVHPRSPYSRVDALRSASSVRVELDGVVLAEAPNCVKLFETGLPTRYYVERMHVDWTKLRRSDTVTRCPYKGTTSGYWSFDSDTASHEDIAWAYDFPTIHANRIAGLAAFYNEHVDLYVDGVLLPRPIDPPGALPSSPEYRVVRERTADGATPAGGRPPPRWRAAGRAPGVPLLGPADPFWLSGPLREHGGARLQSVTRGVQGPARPESP